LTEHNADYTKSRWEKLVYSLLVEIQNSLNNFTSSVMPLTLKNHFEERLQSPIE